MAQTPNTDTTTNPADLAGLQFQLPSGRWVLVTSVDTARDLGMDRETFGAGLPAGDTVVLTVKTGLPWPMRVELVSTRTTPRGRDLVVQVLPLDADPADGFELRRTVGR